MTTDDQRILQIMPAIGWRAVMVAHDDDSVVELPVVCFALLAPPYKMRDEGPDQPVVPMIRDRGSYPTKGMGTFDIVIGDDDWLDNQRSMDQTFVGYLSPEETQTTPWVREGIALAQKHWAGR